MYRTKHFSLRELLPPEVVEVHGYSSRLFMLFDCTALATLDMLRERYGPVIVNDWSWGGSFRYSGWRPWDCPEGATLSQHKMGRAFDCKFADCTAEEVRADVRADPSKTAFSFIRRVEELPDMSWFHFDTGNAGLPKPSGVSPDGRMQTTQGSVSVGHELSAAPEEQGDGVRIEQNADPVTGGIMSANQRYAGHILFIGGA